VAKLKSNLKKNIYLLLSSIFVLLILSEVILRLFGREPYNLEVIDTVAKPGGKLFQPDSLLGYKHLPGKFEITIRNKLVFEATHSTMTTNRITKRVSDTSFGKSKNEIWIFGGSSSYGWGINDDQTYAWLLQSYFKELEIVNFSVNGFGPLHSLIQFKEAIKKNKNVKAAIFAYGSYQDRRSTASRGRRKFFVGPWNKFGNYKQPVAEILDDGRLSHHLELLNYTELPLMRYSALVHTIEKAIIKIENKIIDINGLSKKIIEEFNREATKNNVDFLVAGIWNDELTLNFINWCKTQNISSLDMSVNLLEEGYSNRPYDEHPSSKAHSVYAERLQKYIIDSLINKIN
jgi:hypothetical protein